MDSFKWKQTNKNECLKAAAEKSKLQIRIISEKHKGIFSLVSHLFHPQHNFKIIRHVPVYKY